MKQQAILKPKLCNKCFTNMMLNCFIKCGEMANVFFFLICGPVKLLINKRSAKLGHDVPKTERNTVLGVTKLVTKITKTLKTVSDRFSDFFPK